MPLGLTPEQVLARAPDAASANAGKKLARSNSWQSLGQNQDVIWGECQGSALYQVRIERATLTVACSCPSRKQPCKHGLGLLLLLAEQEGEVAVRDEPPDWVTAWLSKRAAAKAAKETKEQPRAPTASQLKRAGKRRELVTAGVKHLQLFLTDSLRRGLLALAEQPPLYWEDQAARLVDAQAPGLASAVRRMGTLAWAPERLLGAMGKLSLLLEAFLHIDALDDVLREDVRQLVGWTLDQDEVSARGERVPDRWLIVGNLVDDTERIRAQRTWLYGLDTGTPALVLQYANAGSGFPHIYPPGLYQRAEAVFWPSAVPLRALLDQRRGDLLAVGGSLPGAFDAIEGFLSDASVRLARLPWQERFLCALSGVAPVLNPHDSRWYLRDGAGDGLGLGFEPPWTLLSLSGGGPIEVVGEWNGMALHVMGVFAGGTYCPIDSPDGAPPERSALAHSLAVAGDPFASAALKGIGPHAQLPARSGTPADAFLATIEGDTPEHTLLLRAGIWEVYRSAGLRGSKLSALKNEVAAPEWLSVASGDTTRTLAALMREGEDEQAQRALLQEVAASGRRLPHSLLPLALHNATQRTTLRAETTAVLGERGKWLSRLNPDWAWAGLFR